MPRPSGSPAAAPPVQGRQGLWPVALALVLLLVAAAAWPVWRVAPGLAPAWVVAGLTAPGVLWSVYRRHRSALSGLAQLDEAGRLREAEHQRREAEWRRQADTFRALVVKELAFLTDRRLPAALAEGETPDALHTSEQLGADVAEALERLVSGASAAFEDRMESQRLALVELTNRVQTSAHRIQATVSKLAAVRAGDPDLLEAAMQVDHAATQQARYAQSIRVLCDEWPGQQWQKPMALVDVVRAASGRIVAYQRVQVTGDPDVGVVPAVLEQLIHLVAELLANATEYSPPRTNVSVTVRTVQRGAVVEIDDGGLGLDEYRLERAREIVSGKRLLGIGDVGEIPQTGLPVVGRFARRHGLNVELSPSPYGGVRAVVLVPGEHLETLEPAGTQAQQERRRTESASSVAAASPAGPAQALPAQVPHPSPAPHDESQPPAPGRLPQRRSRRGEFDGSQHNSGPAAQTSPATPDEAGSWMGRFLEAGGRPPSSSSSPAAADDTRPEGPKTP